MRNRGVAKHANDMEQGVRVSERRDIEQRRSAGLHA